MLEKKQKNNPSIHSHFKNVADEEVTLKIFDIIEETGPEISQRKIVMKTGLAAGLVHSFMRRVMKKGWIRAKQVNAKRWLYFVTPEGFLEKGRLSMKYLNRTLNAYRTIQGHVTHTLELCRKKEWQKLAIAGDNELAEIAMINMKSDPYFTLVGVFGSGGQSENNQVIETLPFEELSAIEFDKILVCNTGFLEWNMQNGGLLEESKLLNLVSLTSSNG